jgi:pre-mRNA-processing factor 39
LDVFGDAKSIKKALNRHTALFSCKRSILPSKKRKVHYVIVSDREKLAKIGGTQPVMETDPKAPNPPVCPATSEASGQQQGAGYAQPQVTYSYNTPLTSPSPYLTF